MRLIPRQSAWLAFAAASFALLLQGCATVAAPGTAGIRALPQTRIELEAPAFETTPTLAARPSLGSFLSRGSRALGGVLQSALSFTGIRYRYGGSSPVTGFDCSGFVGYVFRESAGLKLPRASHQMASAEGIKISRAELKAGDLVFFGSRKRVNHVGIYLGDDRFIHAPSTGGRVRTDRMSDRYWRARFVSGKRVLDANRMADARTVPASVPVVSADPAGSSEAPAGFAGTGGRSP